MTLMPTMSKCKHLTTTVDHKFVLISRGNKEETEGSLFSDLLLNTFGFSFPFTHKTFFNSVLKRELISILLPTIHPLILE